MERAIPCELPFFYFRSAQFNSSKNITFVPNLQEIFKVVKRTFLYINLVIALFFVLPVSQAKEKTFTVVIDAGHGGKDPGARGSSINEKAINLAVALRLGSLISEKHDDVKVIYTRKTDVFIELDERANIANRNKADLFISIHTNAVKRGSSVSGTETIQDFFQKEQNPEQGKEQERATRQAEPVRSRIRIFIYQLII